MVDDQSFDVDENSALGTEVGTVSATDPDTSDMLSYSFAGGPFAIDSSGKITVAGELEYETTPAYTLKLTVTDDGSPQLSDTAEITITINGVNEKAEIDYQTFDVDENSPAGTEVDNVEATDPEDDTLTFEIVEVEGVESRVQRARFGGPAGTVAVTLRASRRELLQHEDGQYQPYHDLYAQNVREATRARTSRPWEAIVACPWGDQQVKVTQHLRQFTVECGIGYRYTCAKYRVFVSYAWMHFHLGLEKRFDGCRTMEQFVWAARNIDRLDPAACRKWIVDNFSTNRIAPMFEEYYQSLLNLDGEGWYEQNPERDQLDWLRRAHPASPPQG